MPSSAAFFSFEPAPGPATTRSVFAETEPATFAPSRSRHRLRLVARHPLQRAGEDDRLAGDGRGRSRRPPSGSGVTSASSRSSSAWLCSSAKNWTIASATTGPMPSIPSISASASASPSAGARWRCREARRTCRSGGRARRALVSPTWRMPSALMKRLRSTSRRASMAARRFSTLLKAAHRRCGFFAWRPSPPRASARAPRAAPHDALQRFRFVFRRKMSDGCSISPSAIEDLDLLRAEPLDVERVAADEMAQPLHGLRRADEPAGAAAHGIQRAVRLVLAHGIGAAGRARGRELRRASRRAGASRCRRRRSAG